MGLSRWTCAIATLVLSLGIGARAEAQGAGAVPQPPGVRPNQQCAPGSVVTGINPAGIIICVSLPGGGDMLRSTYDADLDGEVTIAEVARALFADPAPCAVGTLVSDIAADGTLTCVAPPAATHLDSGTTLPGSPTQGRVFIVTDDPTVGACTSAGGTAQSFCYWNGSAWVSPGSVSSIFGRTGVVTATAGDYTATLVTNTPAGNIAATTVQAALAELDAEKALLSHAHSAADITSGALALARFTDGGTAGVPLVAGGGGGDPNYALLTETGIDTTAIQRRVTGTCSTGSSIRVIAVDGTVTCEADDVGGGGGGYDSFSTDSGGVAKTGSEGALFVGDFGIETSGVDGTPDQVHIAVTDSEIATQAELNTHAANVDAHHAQNHASRHTAGQADAVTVENLATAGASGTAPVSAGTTLTMTDIATQAELNTHAALATHHTRLHSLTDPADHSLSGATDGYVLQATGATTFEFDWSRTRSAANCQALTDGETNEICVNSTGAGLLFRCVQGAGLCDTSGEWVAISIAEAQVVLATNDGSRHDHVPADIVNGTALRCARFNASGVLEPATGDCAAGDTGGAVGGTVGSTGFVQYAGASVGEHDSESAFAYDEANNQLIVGLLGASPQVGRLVTVPPAATGSTVAITEGTNNCTQPVTTLANCQSIIFQGPASVTLDRTILLEDDATPLPGASMAVSGDGSGTVAALVVTDDSHAHTGTTISNLDAADTQSGTFADDRVSGVNERNEVITWTTVIDRADYASDALFLDAYYTAMTPALTCNVGTFTSPIVVKPTGTVDVQWTDMQDFGDTRAFITAFRSAALSGVRPVVTTSSCFLPNINRLALDFGDLTMNVTCSGQTEPFAALMVGSGYHSGHGGGLGLGQEGALQGLEVLAWPHINWIDACETAAWQNSNRPLSMNDDANYRSPTTGIGVWLNGNPDIITPDAEFHCNGPDEDNVCVYEQASFGSRLGPVKAGNHTAAVVDTGNNGNTHNGLGYSSGGSSPSSIGVIYGNPEGVTPVDGACARSAADVAACTGSGSPQPCCTGSGTGTCTGCTERLVAPSGITMDIIVESYDHYGAVYFAGHSYKTNTYTEGTYSRCANIWGAGICTADDFSICTTDADCPGANQDDCDAFQVNTSTDGVFNLSADGGALCFGPGAQRSGDATTWDGKTKIKITGYIGGSPTTNVASHANSGREQAVGGAPCLTDPDATNCRHSATVDLSDLKSEAPLAWPGVYDGEFVAQQQLIQAPDCTDVTPQIMQLNSICIDNLTTNLGVQYTCHPDDGGTAGVCDHVDDIDALTIGATVEDGEVDNGITVTNYLLLAGGTMTGDLTLSADSNEGLVGAGLVDCDSDGQTLAWDTTTHKFSCGDDDTSAGGAVNLIQENNADAVTGATTVDFLGADFDVTDAGSGEADVAIAAAITRDAEAAAAYAPINPTLGTQTQGNYVATITAGVGITSSGATTGETIAHTIALDYTGTLASPPTFNAEECAFSTGGTGSGAIICEGPTADGNEYLISIPSDSSEVDTYFALGDSTGRAQAGDSGTSFFNAGTVDVNRGGTGIASGTSGGALYFSGSTTIASSAALTDNGIVIGGGAGAAPETVAGLTTDGVSKITVGVAGTSVGSVDFKNATSGTITLSPVTGALGTVTLSLPAATDTLVGKATTDSLTNKTIPSFELGSAATDTTITRASAGVVAVEGVNIAMVGGDIGAATATTPADNDNDTSVATTAMVASVTKSYYIGGGGLEVDGTNCTKPTAAVVNSGPFIRPISCTENAASIIYFDFVTPDNWDLGTITVEGTALTIDATISGGNDDSWGFDVSCQVRRGGNNGDTPSSTWGTAQNLDFVFDTQYEEQHITTAAITANGTAAAGAHLYCRLVNDTGAATDTTPTDFRLLGVKVEYGTLSVSD